MDYDFSVYTPKNFKENQFGIFNKSGNTVILLSRISCHALIVWLNFLLPVMMFIWRLKNSIVPKLRGSLVKAYRDIQHFAIQQFQWVR